MLLVSRSEFVPAKERSGVRSAFSPPASRFRAHESAFRRNPPMRSLGPPAYFRAWQRLAPRLPPSATRRPQTFAASRRFIPLRSFQPCFMLVPPMGFSPSEVHSLTIAAHRLSTRASLLGLHPTALDLCALHRPKGQPSCLHAFDTRRRRSAQTAEAPKRSWLRQSRTSARSTLEHRGALAFVVQSSSATSVVAPRRSACHRWAVVRALARERRRSSALSLLLGRPHVQSRRGTTFS